MVTSLVFWASWRSSYVTLLLQRLGQKREPRQQLGPETALSSQVWGGGTLGGKNGTG